MHWKKWINVNWLWWVHISTVILLKQNINNDVHLLRTRKEYFKYKVLWKWRYIKLLAVSWVKEIVFIYLLSFFPFYPVLNPHRARKIIFLRCLRALCSVKLQGSLLISLINWPIQDIWHSWHFLAWKFIFSWLIWGHSWDVCVWGGKDEALQRPKM